MRYVDNDDGTITDTQTGLQWQAATEKPMTWEAAVDRCAAIGDGWRLPTRLELESILDLGRSGPACDPIFGARSFYYWSSTTTQGYPGLAWVVDFDGGGVDGGGKSGSYAVRAVRGGLAIRPFDDSTPASWRRLHAMSDGSVLWINLDNISTIRQRGTGARLWSISTDECWDVAESLDEVVRGEK